MTTHDAASLKKKKHLFIINSHEHPRIFQTSLKQKDSFQTNGRALSGERDPKQSAQASISAIEGIPFECNGLGNFRQARGTERSVLALAGVLCLREPTLLSRFIAESGEAREGLQLCSVLGSGLHQLRLGGTDSFRNTRVTRIPWSTHFAGTAET
jgi:hypothetical protein